MKNKKPSLFPDPCSLTLAVLCALCVSMAALSGCSPYGEPRMAGTQKAESIVRAAPEIRTESGEVKSDVSTLQESLQDLRQETGSAVNTLSKKFAEEIGSVRDQIQNVHSTVQNYGLNEEMRASLDKYMHLATKIIAGCIIAVIGLCVMLLFLPSPVEGTWRLVGIAAGLVALVAGPLVLWLVL